MTKCIPIVRNPKETYRSKEESRLSYFFYRSSAKSFVYHDYWAKENYDIFLSYHTLEYKKDLCSPGSNNEPV